MDILIKENVLPDGQFEELLGIIERNEHQFHDQSVHSLASFKRWYPMDTGNREIPSMMGKMLHDENWISESSSWPDLAWKLYCGNPDFNFVVQVTKYYPNNMDSFKWHVDHIGIYKPARILNYIFYLTDDFEGGELQISSFDKLRSHPNPNNDFSIDLSIKPKKNMFVMMPAWRVHRVLPVKSGGVRLTVNGHIM